MKKRLQSRWTFLYPTISSAAKCPCGRAMRWKSESGGKAPRLLKTLTHGTTTVDVEVQRPSFSTATPDCKRIFSLSGSPTTGHGLRMLGGPPSPLLVAEKKDTCSRRCKGRQLVRYVSGPCSPFRGTTFHVGALLSILGLCSPFWSPALHFGALLSITTRV